MSQLKKSLQDAIITAMKAGESEKVNALRLLTASIKQVEVDSGKELADSDVTAILRKELKKRQDSHAQYTGAGRQDLAAIEAKEIAIIQSYLPAQMSLEQVVEKVKLALAEQNITEKKDFGRAMGIAMKAVGSDADGNTVKQAVESILA
ncbi:MAG: GatB/YqeY domain-containing protein [Candidatus Abawacabacteria bacterium]|nr:GatB/YqeY domain-containing protein [Candidatus Abawacabacteria bacterium]